MKPSIVIIMLVICAWPFSYLYQKQLGAIPFLLLALFFLYIALKERKKTKKQKNIGKD